MIDELPKLDIVLDGSKIKFVTEATYLGMTFTPKLRWGKHLKQKVAVAKKKIFMYKGCLKPNWGPPQRSMRWLYTGIIRPSITYGCLVWGKEIAKSH